MVEITDRHGDVWTSEQAPPGAFHKAYDDRGRLISYWIMGPASPPHASNRCPAAYTDMRCPVHGDMA
jgi:hypothetical protein